MSSQPITLPNGVRYEQPIGAFINNKFSYPTGEKFEVYDPRLAATELSSIGY